MKTQKWHWNKGNGKQWKKRNWKVTENFCAMQWAIVSVLKWIFQAMSSGNECGS